MCSAALLNLKLTDSSSKKNARDSPLLRLPPEIRSMIWEYVLGEHTIRMGESWHFTFPAQGTAQIHFDLLRVCRQVYVEASNLPRTLNTLSFPDFTSFLETAATGKLHHVQKICLRTFVDCLVSEEGLEYLVPTAAFAPFKTISITLCTEDLEEEGVRFRAETALRARLLEGRGHSFPRRLRQNDK